MRCRRTALDTVDQDRRAFEPDFAGEDARVADERAREFGSAGADETVEAENFAFAERETDVLVAERGRDASRL